MFFWFCHLNANILFIYGPMVNFFLFVVIHINIVDPMRACIPHVLICKNGFTSHPNRGSGKYLPRTVISIEPSTKGPLLPLHITCYKSLSSRYASYLTPGKMRTFLQKIWPLSCLFDLIFLPALSF